MTLTSVLRNAVEEGVSRSADVADFALVQRAGSTLNPLHLKVVSFVCGGRDDVGAAVTGGALHTTVASRLFEVFAWLLKVPSSASVAAAALGLINPRHAIGIAHRGHTAVAGGAFDAIGLVNVSLTVRLHAGVAGVARIGQVCLPHSGGVGTVHGGGHLGDAR